MVLIIPLISSETVLFQDHGLARRAARRSHPDTEVYTRELIAWKGLCLMLSIFSVNYCVMSLPNAVPNRKIRVFQTHNGWKPLGNKRKVTRDSRGICQHPLWFTNWVWYFNFWSKNLQNRFDFLHWHYVDCIRTKDKNATIWMHVWSSSDEISQANNQENHCFHRK